MYELLTFERLPAQDQIPDAMSKATLKAARETSPLPQEIVALLNRLLLVNQPFEHMDSFGEELDRVFYDGDCSPATFNLAFVMYTLFREENDLDNLTLKSDLVHEFWVADQRAQQLEYQAREVHNVQTGAVPYGLIN